MSTLTRSKVAHPVNPVNPASLPEKCIDTLGIKYTRLEGHQAVIDLSQGELDVLELAREALGWPTITSLATKYYPLYPHRKAWYYALQKCKQMQVRTKTLNIKYLLLAVISQVAERLERAFIPGTAPNRLVSTSFNNTGDRYHRLVRSEDKKKPGVARSGPDRYANQRYGHMILS